MSKQTIFLFALFLCVSCSVGPDYEAPKTYSDAVIKNELELKQSGHLPNNWYRNLPDENLRTLIELGLNNNSDIATAISRLKQARLTASVNDAAYLPQVNLQGGYNYQKGSDNITYSPDTRYYSAGFDASWEIDVWGKGRRQHEADIADIRMQYYNLSNVKTMVAAEIANNYISLLQNMANLRIARQNAVLQRQILDMVKSQYDNGLSDQTVYSQSEYLLQTTLAKIPQYESNIETYKNALSVLTGVLPSALNIPEKPLLFKNNYLQAGAHMRELPASVIRLRPDVAAAEEQLKAQNALIGKAVAELYPNVSISALFGYAAKGGRNLFGSDSQTYSYTPAITMPLLDWNRLHNNIEIQKEEKNIALENYRQTVLNAIGELKNSFAEYNSAVRAYQNKVKAQNSMQTVVDLMLKRYKNGLNKFSDVLTSEQNLLAAQEDVILGQAQIARSIIAYYKASGATICN